MEHSLISDYTKDIYRNWANSKFIETTYGNSLSFISSKIRRTSIDGPFIDGDIADFIFQVIGNQGISDEELTEHIQTAIWYMKKGNSEEIFKIIKSKVVRS